MMIPDKKKAMGVILSRYKPDGTMSEGGEVKNEVEMDVKNSALHSHAADMITAIHNKSPSEFVSAMNNFLEEHQLHQDEPESDKEEPSDYSPDKE